MRVSFFLTCAVVGVVSSSTFAALDTTDPSIINLYQLNEHTSGDLTNGTAGSFLDTAPTGTPQNHDDLIASAPTWTSGLPVGDGVGLAFHRSESDYTRFAGWMNTTQGNYSNGKSFTAMVRLNAATLADNMAYNILGQGLNNISLSGSGVPNSASVNVSLRDQNTQLRVDSFGTTGAGYTSTGSAFRIFADTWVNIFLIYSANNTLTVAMDDGTTFSSQTTIGLPVGFDTLAEGFDNPGNAFYVGSLNETTNTFDGTIESIVIWDKALTLSEADAINLTTTGVPEPTVVSVLLLGAAASIVRRPRRS